MVKIKDSVRKKTENEIDEELGNTFPASDAPSWTLGPDPEFASDQTSMKVIRIHAYGGPEQLRYENTPIPSIEDTQVLVRVYAASVNPIDCKLASGALRPVMNNKAVALPWVPGGDFSGVVEAVGPAVMDIKKGDLVYGNSPSGGAYAQYVVAQAHEMAIKPRTLNYAGAASVPIAAQTAWQALFDHGHLQSYQTVLIHGGAGGVGSFAIQLAHWKKAFVAATGSAAHSPYLNSLGVEQIINYKTTPFEGVVRNVDLVIDLIGGETQERSFKTLKPGGILVSTVNPPSEELAQKHNVKVVMMSMKSSTEQLGKLSKLLDDGVLKTNVTMTYPLVQAREAWKMILSHHTQGKIVLILF